MYNWTEQDIVRDIEVHLPIETVKVLWENVAIVEDMYSELVSLVGVRIVTLLDGTVWAYPFSRWTSTDFLGWYPISVQEKWTIRIGRAHNG